MRWTFRFKIVLLPITADSNGIAQQPSPRLLTNCFNGSVVPVTGLRPVIMAGLVKSGNDCAAIGGRLSREGKYHA